VSPHGTRYTFNWMVSYYATALTKAISNAYSGKKGSYAVNVTVIASTDANF